MILIKASQCQEFRRQVKLVRMLLRYYGNSLNLTQIIGKFLSSSNTALVTICYHFSLFLLMEMWLNRYCPLKSTRTTLQSYKKLIRNTLNRRCPLSGYPLSSKFLC